MDVINRARENWNYGRYGRGARKRVNGPVNQIMGLARNVVPKGSPQGPFLRAPGKIIPKNRVNPGLGCPGVEQKISRGCITFPKNLGIFIKPRRNFLNPGGGGSPKISAGGGGNPPLEKTKLVGEHFFPLLRRCYPEGCL